MFNAGAAHVLGLDIGAHTVAVRVADLRGDAIATVRRRVSPDLGAARRLAVATEAVTGLLEEAKIDGSGVLAVTVGTPGTISPRDRRIGTSPGMPGWSQTDLVAVLRERVGFLALTSDSSGPNPALVELGRRALVGDRKSRLADPAAATPARLTAEEITLAASEGDLTATRALRAQVRVLAKGIAPALLTLNPDVLVVGGGMSRAGEVLRELLLSQVEDLLLYPPEIRISALGDEAVLVGAVDQSIERVERNVLSKVLA